MSSPVGGDTKGHTSDVQLTYRPVYLLMFDVIGLPRPEPRPRSRQGQVGVYVPGGVTKKAIKQGSADVWKLEVRAQAELAQALDPSPFAFVMSAALRVDVVFRFPRPKVHWRTGRYSGKLKSWAPFYHATKPDRDNLDKAVLDALGEFKGLPPLVWWDDAQVVDGKIIKRYVREGEEPGATVAVYEP